LKWLRIPEHYTNLLHGETLAKYIEDRLCTPAADGWDLKPPGSLCYDDARDDLIEWLYRCENAPAYCSPRWTRNFSLFVDMYLWTNRLGTIIDLPGILSSDRIVPRAGAVDDRSRCAHPDRDRRRIGPPPPLFCSPEPGRIGSCVSNSRVDSMVAHAMK